MKDGQGVEKISFMDRLVAVYVFLVLIDNMNVLIVAETRYWITNIHANILFRIYLKIF